MQFHYSKEKKKDEKVKCNFIPEVLIVWASLNTGNTSAVKFSFIALK